MTDFMPINDNDVFIFNRLATLSSERHDPLPLRKFFSDSTLESSKLVEHELVEAIMELHHTKHPNDIPEQSIVFSFEYIPWADHNGEHDEILTTTLIGEIDPEIGPALISHIVTTGPPISRICLMEATGLRPHVERVGSVALAAGILIGGLVIIFLDAML